MVIAVDGLQFSYRKTPVLKGVTFSIPNGAVVGLLGPNGAGKTTLIRLLLGLLAPTSGAVAIDGLNPMTHPRMVKSKVGIVHQNRNFDLDVSVLDNLHIYGALQGIPKKVREQRISLLAEEFELSDLKHKDLRTLSGGQQRRVQLARAFIHDPKVVILDEPTANLDSYWRLKVQESIRRRSKERLLTVIWTSHDMREIEAATDRVLLLKDGLIAGDDHPQVFARRLTGEYIWMMASGGSEWTEAIPGVLACRREQEWLVMHVDSAEQRLPLVLQTALSSGLQVQSVRVEPATLEKAMLEFHWGKKS